MIYWPVWFSCLKNDDINFEDFEGQKEGNKNKYKVLLNIIKYYLLKANTVLWANTQRFYLQDK